MDWSRTTIKSSQTVFYIKYSACFLCWLRYTRMVWSSSREYMYIDTSPSVLHVSITFNWHISSPYHCWHGFCNFIMNSYSWLYIESPPLASDDVKAEFHRFVVWMRQIRVFWSNKSFYSSKLLSLSNWHYVRHQNIFYFHRPLRGAKVTDHNTMVIEKFTVLHATEVACLRRNACLREAQLDQCTRSCTYMTAIWPDLEGSMTSTSRVTTTRTIIADVHGYASPCRKYTFTLCFMTREQGQKVSKVSLMTRPWTDHKTAIWLNSDYKSETTALSFYIFVLLQMSAMMNDDSEDVELINSRASLSTIVTSVSEDGMSVYVLRR